MLFLLLSVNATTKRCCQWKMNLPVVVREVINYSWQKLTMNITSYVVVRTCQNLSEVVTHCYESTEYYEYYTISTAYNNIGENEQTKKLVHTLGCITRNVTI